jgi:hypothetical protein
MIPRVAIWIVFAVLWIWLDIAVPWRHLESTAGDFRAYHEAARALAAGESPYSESAFIYPPLLPVMLLPLAPLPLESARVVWFFASQAALLGSLWLMLPLCGPGTAGAAALAVVWIAGGSVQENLVLGQANPFLLLAIGAAMRLLPRRASGAAASIGAAAAIKIWPAVLLFLLALRRAWRPLLAGVAVTTALIAAPAVITLMMADDASPLGGDRPLRVGSAAPLNVSLPGLALRLVDSPRDGEMPKSWIDGVAPGGFAPWGERGWLAAAVAALVLGGGMVALARPPPRATVAGRDDTLASSERQAWALDLGALAAVAILAAPIGWYHYQLCQFPLFSIVLARRLDARRYRSAFATVLVLIALTRGPAWAFGRYVDRFGFTAEAPVWLWIATSVGPVVGLGWMAWAIREARHAAHRGDERSVSPA